MPTIADIRKQYPQYEDMSDAALAKALHSKFYADMPEAEFNAKIGLSADAPAPEPVDAAKAERDKYYSSGIYAGAYNPLGTIAKTVDAFASGAQRAPMFGWDDEIVGGIRSAAGNTDYTTAQAQESAKKQAMRQQNPIASTVGELAGGLATGGTIASTGATLAGRNLPVIGRTGGAALEGMGYGALTGAGEADPGSRGTGAVLGGIVGAGTGAATAGVGDFLAGQFAKKASAASAPSIDDLAAASNNLYTQAKQANVAIKPQSADRVINNMNMVAGRVNRDLRPRTAGVLEDINAIRGQPMDLQTFDELRQTIGQAMKNADPQDVRTLQLMKNQLDGFADRVGATDVTGDVKGFQMLKDARGIWAKKSKTEAIEDMLDIADVDSAKYSQSGQANAIRLKAAQLYKRIVAGKEKGFTQEETDLVRKLAKNEMTPAVVSWIAKFAPRGVVSFGAGLGAGSLIPGVGTLGVAIPGALGYGAAALTDRAAIQGANALRNAAASGNAPVLKAITNKTVPFIGGTASPLASQITRTR